MSELSPLRQGRITASSVGAILGLSPHTTRRDVLERMRKKTEFVSNVATDYGNANEAGAIMEFEWQNKKCVKPSFFYMFQNWLGATPDGEVDDDSLLEVKCPYGLRNGGEHKSIHEQLHYYAQVQVQMWCADKKKCYFWQWSPTSNMLEIIDRDDDYLGKILPELFAFYEEYKQPELDVAALLAEYDRLTIVIEESSERKKELLDTLVELCNNENCIINGRKLTLVQRDGSVSYAKAIKDLLPDADLSGYKGKPTEYWRLS